ncbi:hypothetical protein GCM10025872_10080 [Barrientosiimonas endolithica]|uniref:Uncharacterized protein n=1 Tax=Barrientosiimonas endolithica TaxID=1535208 RepID=A0ABM8H8W5_9MICO|nr:hypothetical protein GCM10025872_10080 [Barrientosiimonas endolithica]
MHAGLVVVATVDERRVGEHQRRAVHQRAQVGRLVGVTGVGDDRPVGLDAQPVRLDRVLDEERLDRERAYGESGSVAQVAEVEAVAEVLGPVDGVHPGEALGRARGGVHRDRRHRALGVIGAHDVEAGEVGAVVGVQVAEHDRVELVERDVALQRPERAVAQVERDAPGAPLVLGLHEVAGRG